MSSFWWISALVVAYLGVNFLCALMLHRHADRQAHLPRRTAEVLVHFVLLTAFGLPILLAVTAIAIFAAPEPDAALGRSPGRASAHTA